MLLNTETLSTQTVTTVATGYLLRFTGTGNVTLSGTATGTFSAGTHSITATAGTLTLTVSGTVTQADLRTANVGVNLPVYQRVNTATDYDTSGFPLYLLTDGVDDWYQTNSINFTATDKMTVFAGVRKLSDAAFGIICELSSDINANNGTYVLYGNNSPAYTFQSKGSGIASAVTGASFAAPITNVLTGIGNIGGDQSTLRANGTQAANSTTDQGTGNYGNHKLYLFMRGGASLPFNGWMFGALIKGATLSASQIALAERWLASKTKTVTLA